MIDQEPLSTKRVAVVDGFGSDAEVSLRIEDLEWPDGWPETVSREFLADHGFEVITA